MATVTGCGGGKDGPVHTLTKEQAAQRVEQHLNAAVDQIVPRPALEPGLKSTLECFDPSDNGPLGRVTVEHRYLMPSVAPADGAAVLDILASYWNDHGYRLLRDQRDKRLAEIAVEADDGFRVVVTTNVAGQLSLIGSSPCVWPDGSRPAG
jgi:hypothetical protein